MTKAVQHESTMEHIMTPIKLISGPILGGLAPLLFNESNFVGIGAAVGGVLVMWWFSHQMEKQKMDSLKSFDEMILRITKLEDKIDSNKSNQQIICKMACEQLDKIKEAVVELQKGKNE